MNEDGLLKEFLIKLFELEILKDIKISEEEKKYAIKSFTSKLNLSNQKLQLLNKNNPQLLKKIENEALKNLRMMHLFKKLYLDKAANFFDQNKSKYDKFIYSLIRNKDRNIVYELYYQIESGESSINELARVHSEGSEKLKKGLIGPVRNIDLDPLLLKELEDSESRIVSQPFQIMEHWYIVQKEEHIVAKFDSHLNNEISKEFFKNDLESKYEEFISLNNLYFNK